MERSLIIDTTAMRQDSCPVTLANVLESLIFEPSPFGSIVLGLNRVPLEARMTDKDIMFGGMPPTSHVFEISASNRGWVILGIRDSNRRAFATEMPIETLFILRDKCNEAIERYYQLRTSGQIPFLRRKVTVNVIHEDDAT